MSVSIYNLGLSSEEAKRRLLENGPNEIVPTHFESIFDKFKSIILDPMGLMLLGLAALYAVLGEFSDAIPLLLAFIPITLVDVLLKTKARNALNRLQKSIKLKARVIRDGKPYDIESKNIVIGDLVVLTEGQSLPADGKIIETDFLSINEASLTGESVPVVKSKGDFFFAGTTILKGHAYGLVEQTGRQTQFGKIANLVKETDDQKTPLQKKIGEFVRKFLMFAFALALILFCIEYMRLQKIIPSLVIALTFGMAAVPEEFPLVFTLYLSMGAWRLSRYGVLVKSLPSVETLGSVDIICTDKTGTLTEGSFKLEYLYTTEGKSDQEFHWKCALMACEETLVDSLEIAIFDKAKSHQNQLENWSLKKNSALDQKHMSNIWEHKSESVLAMKGAVEDVLDRCEINEKDRKYFLSQTETYASQGKRILGLAFRKGPFLQNREQDERNLNFLGLLVFSDPIRSGVSEAIEKCQKAGIEVKMLTGDHPFTAHAIADQTGIIHSHEFLFSGKDLAQMSKEEQTNSYLKGAIFSRISSEQKFELIKVLKENGKVVAMTGDGINDVPALKLADIGISMGPQATDVARTTAKMVLLKNDFKGIVEAVFEGRRIFSNLKRSFSYLISFHIPLVLLTLLPPLFGWGDLFLPIHIVLLELVVHPVSSFAFENLPLTSFGTEKKSLMPKSRLLECTLSGILASLFALFLFKFFLESMGKEAARTMVLSSVLFANIAFVWIESFPHRNLKVLSTMSSLFIFTLFVIYFGFVRDVLHLTYLSPFYLFLSFVLGISSSLPNFVMQFFTKKF